MRVRTKYKCVVEKPVKIGLLWVYYVIQIDNVTLCWWCNFKTNLTLICCRLKTWSWITLYIARKPNLHGAECAGPILYFFFKFSSFFLLTLAIRSCSVASASELITNQPKTCWLKCSRLTLPPLPTGYVCYSIFSALPGYAHAVVGGWGFMKARQNFPCALPNTSLFTNQTRANSSTNKSTTLFTCM